MEACSLDFLKSRRTAVRMLEPEKAQPSPEEIWGTPLPVIQPEEITETVHDLVRFITTTSWHSPFDRLRGNQRLSYALECIVGAQLHPPESDPTQLAILHRVQKIVQRQFSTLRTARNIADQLGMSTSTLEKTYRSQSGETPTAYLRRYRLMEVERLLSTTDPPINEIARLVGYRDGALDVPGAKNKMPTPGRVWRRSTCPIMEGRTQFDQVSSKAKWTSPLHESGSGRPWNGATPPAPTQPGSRDSLDILPHPHQVCSSLTYRSQ